VVVAGLVLGTSGPPASAAPASGDSAHRQTNLALGGKATQSSTWGGLPTATADKAIDGNLDGVFSNGSVTHTGLEANPWWQVDLGASYAISDIEVYNRSDCCQERLDGAQIVISNTPFDTSLSPAERAKRPGVTTLSPLSSGASARYQKVDRAGRYVMIQAEGWRLFSLAEVRVLGTASLPSQLELRWDGNWPLDVDCAPPGEEHIAVAPTFTRCWGPPSFAVVPNADGTVKLKSPNVGKFVRYAPGERYPFQVDGDGDSRDSRQSFLITTREDGRVAIRNADRTSWRVTDTFEVVTAPDPDWDFDSTSMRWGLFTVIAQ